jgi:outer membrane lipoprotein-sorting protein
MRKLQIGLMALASAALPARGQNMEWFARKGVEALGGAGKIEAVRSERMTGRIAFGSEAAVPLSVELKRPGKIRTQVEFKAGTFVQGYDGRTGWTIDPSRGGKLVVLTPEQARNFPEQADMDGPLLGWKRRGIRLEVEGREKVRGIDALKIRVTLANGVVRYLDLDASTYRKVRWQGELGEGDGKQTNESFFADYRKVGGLLFPFRIESGAGGRVTQTIVFEKVEMNPPIPDSRFSMPK